MTNREHRPSANKLINKYCTPQLREELRPSMSDLQIDLSASFASSKQTMRVISQVITSLSQIGLREFYCCIRNEKKLCFANRKATNWLEKSNNQASSVVCSVIVLLAISHCERWFERRYLVSICVFDFFGLLKPINQERTRLTQKRANEKEIDC